MSVILLHWGNTYKRNLREMWFAKVLPYSARVTPMGAEAG